MPRAKKKAKKRNQLPGMGVFFEEHAAGRGTPLLGEMSNRGISWRVVRTWRKRDGYFEQELKRNNGLADLCPVCSPKRRRKK